MTQGLGPYVVAEFFAGIGLVRRAVEAAGGQVVFANDIDPVKRRIYATNFGDDDFVLGDIANVEAEDVPEVDLATASFPCTDLSLAGNRLGLGGSESGTFWHFAALLRNLGDRRPRVVLMENVAGLGSSHDGDDLRSAIEAINSLGYVCDLIQLNALRWVPQSRPRVFIVGSLDDLSTPGNWGPDELRPAWIRQFVERNPNLRMQPARLALPNPVGAGLGDVVERLAATDPRWWGDERYAAFTSSLSDKQAARLNALRVQKEVTWRTAYRRTRGGSPVWEIRADDISGCLRTTRGGSSRQAVVEAGQGAVRVRWMTYREYAALMGAAMHSFEGVSENQALFGLGDAVCVPAVAWLLREYIVPLISGEITRTLMAV